MNRLVNLTSNPVTIVAPTGGTNVYHPTGFMARVRADGSVAGLFSQEPGVVFIVSDEVRSATDRADVITARELA
jgi:hypothetical protein